MDYQTFKNQQEEAQRASNRHTLLKIAQRELIALAPSYIKREIELAAEGDAAYPVDELEELKELKEERFPLQYIVDEELWIDGRKTYTVGGGVAWDGLNLMVHNFTISKKHLTIQVAEFEIEFYTDEGQTFTISGGWPELEWKIPLSEVEIGGYKYDNLKEEAALKKLEELRRQIDLRIEELKANRGSNGQGGFNGK